MVNITTNLSGTILSCNLGEIIIQKDEGYIDSAVVRQIKAQIVAVLRGGCLNTRRLADVVNFIRQREDIFEAWHSSDVAELFRPPVFRNRKNSAGYFF